MALRTFVVLLSMLLTVAEARPDNQRAADVVNSLQKTLLSVMKNAEDLGVVGRYAELLPPLHEAYDFEKMIRFATGSAWRSATPEQRENLVEVFGRLSVSTYAARFDGYSGENFETLGEREGPRGSVLVDTQIVRSPDPPVGITYVMTEDNGQWRIIDLLLEGKVSEMATRRSEYNPILREGGPDKLAAALDAKAEALLAE